jgi:hypothetical protein
MPPSRSDTQLLVIATGAVLLAGALVAAVLLFATSRGGGPKDYRPFPAGLASSLRSDLRDGGPYYFPDPFGGQRSILFALEDGNIVAAKVLEDKNPNFGYNALTHEYGDMMKMGVIVPTKVERTALQNAASISGLLLTTDAIVSDIKEDKPEPAGAPGAPASVSCSREIRGRCGWGQPRSAVAEGFSPILIHMAPGSC